MTSASLILLFAALTAQADLPAKPLGVEECVALAVEHSARVHSGRADVDLYRARADQIEALMSPKISGMAFLAPLFGAEGGVGWGNQDYKRDLGRWGPYAHGQFQIVKPLSTFGRVTAGATAARERVIVEKERLREITHEVRAQIRRLYGLRLFAQSMKPSLETGQEILKSAIEKADEMYEAQSGDVTVADRMKLRFGAGEVDRFLRMAIDGIALTEVALKQAMGLPLDAPVTFTDELMTPPAEDANFPALKTLITTALGQRPELGQIEHGRKATAAWQEAEARGFWPVLFAAVIGQGDWTNVRPRGYSATGYNMFNDFLVGAAVGLKFDIDLAMIGANEREAIAKGRWVEAQAALAATGIPLQVKKSHQELEQHRDLAAVAEEQVKATRKWMTFSAAGYTSGTAEAKDVLEGVAAYLMSKKNYYEHLLGVWQARSDIEQFTAQDL